MVIRLSAAALVAAAAALSAAPALADIMVHDGYARSSNPQAGAAFLTIHNPGGPDDRLIGVRSDAAARVELHTHVEDGGVMRMVHVEEGLPLPADGEIAMQRGGNHVMFMGLAVPFDDGAVVPLTLIFETAGEIAVEVTVDNARTEAPESGMMHGEGMDHGTMHDAIHGDGDPNDADGN